MRLLLRLLLSRKIAVGAMAVLGAVLAVAALVADVDRERLEELRATHPARVWVFETLHPQELTRSTLFLVLPGYVALAVAASIVQRARGWLRARKSRGPAPLERFVVRRTAHVALPPEEAVARLDASLRAVGLPAGHGPPEARHGHAGDLGFAGSLVFHLGLLVTLVGVAGSSTGRFNGEFVVAEGVPFVFAPGTMLNAFPPEGLAPLYGTRVLVGQVAAAFGPTGTLTDVSAVLEVQPPLAEPWRQMVSVNVPVDIGGYLLTLHRYGFAPELVATGPDGRERTSGLAVVRVLPPGTEDSVSLGGPEELRLAFFPDFRTADGRPRSASLQPLRPVVAFRWLEHGREVARGLVERGTETTVNGYRVAFRSLSYWADFVVGKDPGFPWVAAGASLIILGLAVRLGWREQAWQASVVPEGQGSRIAFTVSARYFPAFLEERAELLAQKLEEHT